MTEASTPILEARRPLSAANSIVALYRDCSMQPVWRSQFSYRSLLKGAL